MITRLLTILIAGFILFELIEHVLFPLLWSFVTRNRKSLCGNDGMLGKIVEVRSWRDGEGRVLVDGEIWNAASDDHLQSGDRAVVQEVNGLVLKIASKIGMLGSMHEAQ
jgi:membrane protein implicated in regulation of membrane protease activity